MTPTSARAAVAPLLIAAAVIIGGHMMLIGPAKARLAQARARAIEADESARRLQDVRSALPALAAVGERARSDAAAIERANAPACDPGSLFATLAELAAEHRVRVDQLDPFVPRRDVTGTAGTPAPAPASSPVPDAARLPPDTQLGYTMTVVASYTDLAGFLGAIQTRLGFTRVLSVRIVACDEGPDGVTARIQTVHHAFSLPPLPPLIANAVPPEDQR